jgi:hypothetical protein
LGFVAQEVEKAAKDDHFIFNGLYTPQNDDDNYALDYGRFVVPLVKAVQELDSRDKNQEPRIAALEEDNKNLKSEIETLKSQVKLLQSSIIQKQNSTSFSGIRLSPNPVKDILHIEGLPLSSIISIVDINGKLLQQTVTANSSYSINVKKLSAGLYFIKIAEGEKNASLKFIKE